jgi:hypothetical protein
MRRLQAWTRAQQTFLDPGRGLHDEILSKIIPDFTTNSIYVSAPSRRFKAYKDFNCSDDIIGAWRTEYKDLDVILGLFPVFLDISISTKVIKHFESLTYATEAKRTKFLTILFQLLLVNDYQNEMTVEDVDEYDSLLRRIFMFLEVDGRWSKWRLDKIDVIFKELTGFGKLRVDEHIESERRVLDSKLNIFKEVAFMDMFYTTSMYGENIKCQIRSMIAEIMKLASAGDLFSIFRGWNETRSGKLKKVYVLLVILYYTDNVPYGKPSRSK